MSWEVLGTPISASAYFSGEEIFLVTMVKSWVLVITMFWDCGTFEQNIHNNTLKRLFFNMPWWSLLKRQVPLGSKLVLLYFPLLSNKLECSLLTNFRHTDKHSSQFQYFSLLTYKLRVFVMLIVCAGYSYFYYDYRHLHLQHQCSLAFII